MIHPLITIAVRVDDDVVLARQRARQIADGLGFDHLAQTRIATAVSEIVRNAFRYAGGGRVAFEVVDGPGSQLRVAVVDHGPGIARLDEILAGTSVSKTGMGMGLIGAKRLIDRVDIATIPGRGTTVTLAQTIPNCRHGIDRATIDRVAAELSRPSPFDLQTEVQRQNRDLLRTLEELASLNRELEDTNRGVVALYAELDTRADYLRRASDLKTRFLANMSHEFRTPLNSIQALANLLLAHVDGPLSAEQEKQVGLIRRSAENLRELVDDLLDLAKVEAGKMTVRPVTFSVGSLFGALKGLLRPLLAHDGKVALEFDEPRDLPELTTDEGKVSQILRNLIANALKFTVHGEVRVRAWDASQGRIGIAVSDTGVGIAEEHRGAIFEEFIQVDSAQPGREKGTGLGLPLSRRLAERLGGTLEVASNIGQGSTFTLIVPARYRGESDAPDPAAPARSPDGSERTPSRSLLVIDDDEAARYILRGLLPPGLEVVECAAGDAGLEAARNLHPAAIVLDLELPGLSGFEVLARLRDDPDTSAIPVIISSSRRLDDGARQRLAGAVAVLSKQHADLPAARAALRQALTRAGVVV